MGSETAIAEIVQSLGEEARASARFLRGGGYYNLGEVSYTAGRELYNHGLITEHTECGAVGRLNPTPLGLAVCREIESLDHDRI